MNDRRCIICGEHGPISLGIRARYSNTNAVWAPNLDAYLCEGCANAGVEIAIAIKPTIDGRVTTRTRGACGDIQQSLIIGSGEKVSPGQGSLV